MSTDDIAICAEVDAEMATVIEQGLDAFNEAHLGPDPTRPLSLVCRNEAGDVIGGLRGAMQWDVFAIAILWVREEHRGRGIGRRLLARAEELARDRGCTRCLLATMTFQAPDFYRKAGYFEIGRLSDFPPGHSYLWMTKTLSA